MSPTELDEPALKPCVADYAVDGTLHPDILLIRSTDSALLQSVEPKRASNNKYSEISPISDINTDTCSSSLDQPEHPPLLPSILKLPKEILSLLKAGFSGTPLPASLSQPSPSPTTILDTKIQWEGSWSTGWRPKWGPIPPDEKKIGKIAKPFLGFCGIDPDNFSVLPFSQGMWNKLYLIKSKDKATDVTTERIFRIPLPVNPWFKTQSEVATMEYARLNTSIPIPKVYVFESSMENDLGFEWMIMEKIDGRTFADVEDSMDRMGKERLHATIADWVHEISLLQFDVIGSLYREWDPTKDNYLDFYLGPVTSDYFLGPWRTEKPVFKGPFRNEAELLRAVVTINLQDVLDPKHLTRAKRAWASNAGIDSNDHQDSKDETIEDGVDSDSNSDCKAPMTLSYSSVYSQEESFGPSGVQQACFTFLDVLPLVERSLKKAPRNYVLHHFDISKRNVLLNDAGDAIALLDWENIATESLSQIHPWPSIIDSFSCQITRLTADAFMSRLKELQSPWPQIDAAGVKQNYTNEFEGDLAELGYVAKVIYAGWGETEICGRIRQKCEDVLLPIATQVPRVTVDQPKTNV